MLLLLLVKQNYYLIFVSTLNFLNIMKYDSIRRLIMAENKTIKKNLCVVIESVENCFGNFEFQLFDDKDNLIYKKFQCMNKSECYDICKEGNYKLKVTSLYNFTPRIAYRWTKLKPCCCCVQYFKFLPIKKPPKIVRVNFLLTDANYKNLPIEKGVISLWHNIMLP